MNPKVSVMVPVYKVEPYIERCARSLFEQTLDGIEYIFVDDRSPDGSMAILERVIDEYPARKPWVKIVRHPENRGQAAARNTGMSQAMAEYTIYCDSDDWVEPDMYEKMYQTAIREDADMVCCGLINEYASHTHLDRYPKGYDDKRGLAAMYWSVLFSSSCNKMIRRKLYTENAISYYEGINMWEDLGVMTRLRYFSRKTVAIPEAFYHYNKQNEGSTSSIPALSSIEQQIACSVELERFFSGRPDGNRYQLLVDSIKFDAKSMLLHSRPLRDLPRWKALFPETHRHIMRYNLRLDLKILGWLAAHGMPRLACAMIDAKPAIKKLLKR